MSRSEWIERLEHAAEHARAKSTKGTNVRIEAADVGFIIRAADRERAIERFIHYAQFESARINLLIETIDAVCSRLKEGGVTADTT